MAQIDNNTVDSKNQLEQSQYVSFFGNPEGKLRILFVGNSITRHGPKADIGWERDWGMAASDMDHDYVHILANQVSRKVDGAFCICQAGLWEREYRNGQAVYSLFQNAREFGADVIIMRCIENIRMTVQDAELFRREYLAFLDFLNGKKTDQVILTSSFWYHPGDGQILEIGQERGYPYIPINDLGELDEMKATGLFAHKGVAMHPGDKGMATIAERIWTVLEEMI